MANSVVRHASGANLKNLEQWEKIYSAASKKSRRRNELAHNVIYYGRLTDIGGKALFVGDPRMPGKNSRLFHHDLEQIRDSFIALSNELMSFWQMLLPNEQLSK